MKRTLLLVTSLFIGTYTANAQCASGQIEVAIEILTDNFGQETEWNLLNSNGAILVSGGQSGIYTSNTLYTQTVCVAASECLRFEISDDFGDGICCGNGTGSYSVSVDGAEVASGGDFGAYTFDLFNCPPGSSCGDALTVTEGSYTAPATNTWYSFTPPETGTYAIEACNNSCDSKYGYMTIALSSIGQKTIPEQFIMTTTKADADHRP
jgi:hypothetical protein